MTGIFLMATQKIFDGNTSNLENLPQKLVLFFFQLQIEFCTQTNIFQKLRMLAFFSFQVNFFPES